MKTVVKKLAETIKDPEELEAQIKAAYPRLDDFDMWVKERKEVGVTLISFPADSTTFCSAVSIADDITNNPLLDEDDEDKMDADDIKNLTRMLSEIDATDFSKQVLIGFVVNASGPPLYYRWDI